MKTSFELFGYEIGPGWVPLVEDLIKQLKTETDWDGDIHQVKEKFGGLRFYIGYGSDKIWNIIGEYEKRSYTICEMCGQPGLLRGDLGWMKTLCEEHYNKIQNERLQRN